MTNSSRVVKIFSQVYVNFYSMKLFNAKYILKLKALFKIHLNLNKIFQTIENLNRHKLDFRLSHVT